MKRRPEYINKWLIIPSWIYGFIVFVRNKLFDWKILKEKQYDIHIISVGNITVGGTGKTPHIEYLISILRNNYKIAVLSRGYKRKTSGFLIATHHSTHKDIGDEPLQIKLKFPEVMVAVDESRRRGIRKLMALKEKPDIILLDDAFQHRYVKPSLSIMLTDFNRPVYKDMMLPAGRLREPFNNMARANIIVMTKCPMDLKPIDIRIITHELNIYPYQTLLFTTVEYGDLVSLFNKKDLFSREEMPIRCIAGKKVLMVTGIANPMPMQKELEKYTEWVQVLKFPDHHDFTTDDIKRIEQKFNEINEPDSITIVTEKDAVRLLERNDLSDPLKRSLFYLPIQIAFISAEEKLQFNDKIKRHVRKDPRNIELH